jgi:hypothetical protein
VEATILNRIHSRKFGAAIVGAAIMLVGTSVDAETGSIHLTVVKAGFIVSTGSGTGTLDYQGRTYRLSVSSFGFGTIGVSGGELVGTAHNLRTAADIAGTYKAAAAGLTVGAGGQVARFSECERCHPRIGWSTAWLSGIPWFGWDDHRFASSVMLRILTGKFIFSRTLVNI